MKQKKYIIVLLAVVVAFAIVLQMRAKTEGTAALPDKEQVTVELTKSEFLKRVANLESNPNEWKYLGDRPAVIDFYATWCGPCKRLSPILEELAAEYKGKLYVYKVDVDKERELAGMFDIRSVPSLLFIPKDGKPQMSAGSMSKEALEQVIRDVLGVEK